MEISGWVVWNLAEISFDIRDQYSNLKIETVISLNFQGKKKSYNALWSAAKEARQCEILKEFQWESSTLLGHFWYLFGTSKRFEKKYFVW